MTYAELLEEIAATAYRYSRGRRFEDRLRLFELAAEWRRRRDEGKSEHIEADEVYG